MFSLKFTQHLFRKNMAAQTCFEYDGSCRFNSRCGLCRLLMNKTGVQFKLRESDHQVSKASDNVYVASKSSTFSSNERTFMKQLLSRKYTIFKNRASRTTP